VEEEDIPRRRRTISYYLSARRSRKEEFSHLFVNAKDSFSNLQTREKEGGSLYLPFESNNVVGLVRRFTCE